MARQTPREEVVYLLDKTQGRTPELIVAKAQAYAILELADAIRSLGTRNE